MKCLAPLLLVLLLCTCDRAQNSQAVGESDSQTVPPNIILILTDDQGYGDIAAHGNEWINTPEMDKLHDESVRFTNFHAGTTCAPTRSGLMSGVNCNRAGAWHTVVGRSMLGRRFVTLADELKDEGYTTGIFGKWHLGDNYPFRPQDRGFDEVVIHGGGGVGQTPDAWGNDYFDDTYFHNGKQEKYEGYCTDIWFREGMRFIEGAKKSDKPFFAYISTNAPHGPFHIEDKYVAPYKDNPAIPNPRFYGMISNLDDNIGQLREMLKTSGLDENTLIIFMTDNGSAAGARLASGGHVKGGYNAGMRGMKGSEYDGGHRVPLFLRFPKKYDIKPAAYNELTAYTDVMPTLIDFIGGSIEIDYALDGTSLLPLIKEGKQSTIEDRIVVVDTQRGDLPVEGKRSCVMKQDWRLINGKELYNLETDPGQRENLFAANQELVEEMQTAYDAWWQNMQPDIAVMNRIIIGHKDENPALLTSHDWHTEADPAWNQMQIRAGKVDNGWWALEVAEAGNYRLTLHRWPPALGLPFNATVPEGEAIPNGKPYATGEVIEPVKVMVKIGEEPARQVDFSASEPIMTQTELAAGPVEIQTWITDAKGVERGAFYVEVERLE